MFVGFIWVVWLFKLYDVLFCVIFVRGGACCPHVVVFMVHGLFDLRSCSGFRFVSSFWMLCLGGFGLL